MRTVFCILVVSVLLVGCNTAKKELDIRQISAISGLSEKEIKKQQAKIDIIRSFLEWSGPRPRPEMSEDDWIRNLIPILIFEDEAMRSASAEMLCRITGQDFGEDYAAWKAWYEKSKDK